MSQTHPPMLRTVTPAALPTIRRAPFSAATLAQAQVIVEAVRSEGESALRGYAQRFDALSENSPLLIDRDRMATEARRLSPRDRDTLQRAADRIATFAQAQRRAITDVEYRADIPGTDITLGHRVLPMHTAGCYAPGGRYPLPSSVLMTAITARAAGVTRVIVASPKPTPITLAAAHIAGADALMPIGGAHAIAALAFGVAAPRCDVVVGPGNAWVTAAKFLVSAEVAIDMLAGPSEVVILADHTGDPRVIAADLLAQAEHDDDALAILVTDHAPLIDAANAELVKQLIDLPTAATARNALARSFAVLTTSEAESIAVCNTLAPEHLEVHAHDRRLDTISSQLNTYGAIFIGHGAAEVLGDYGLGPNHTLPTGGTARFAAGLSVYNFLRARTHIRAPQPHLPRALCDELAHFARLEGLEAHARAIEARRTDIRP